ncbi:hypothetical protein LCGC14_0940670 [marine sediment metagenome]|uniref:Uncharacterized protein n=1 Tax=marine sediment metagenome TaxID=412755 RepID=A0A0F9RRH7_9ZZZZ
MSLSGSPLKSSTTSSVSGSWTPLDANKRELGMHGMEVASILWAAGTFQDPIGAAAGAYVSPTSGSYLHLRDFEGDVFYTIYSTGTRRFEGGAVFDLLQTPLVMQFPISYFDSEGGNTIVILGEYK